MWVFTDFQFWVIRLCVLGSGTWLIFLRCILYYVFLAENVFGMLILSITIFLWNNTILTQEIILTNIDASAAQWCVFTRVVIDCFEGFVESLTFYLGGEIEATSIWEIFVVFEKHFYLFVYEFGLRHTFFYLLSLFLCEKCIIEISIFQLFLTYYVTEKMKLR